MDVRALAIAEVKLITPKIHRDARGFFSETYNTRALAEDAASRLDITFRPGDIQFVHNHTILHDRTSFVDWPEPERKRHLLRLWLAAPGARPLPPVYAERYGSVEVGDRGGIICPGTKLHAPLEAV